MMQTMSQVFKAHFSSRTYPAELELGFSPTAFDFPNDVAIGSKGIRICFLQPWMAPILSKLKRLDMSFRISSLKTNSTALFELLGRCPSLRDLTLRVPYNQLDETGFMAEPEPLFETVCLERLHLPKLNRLQLHGYDINGFHLYNFFTTHCSTLRKIVLNDMVLRIEGSWELILRIMRNRMRLTGLQFNGRYEIGREDELALVSVEVSAASTGSQVRILLYQLLREIEEENQS
jgi:hypothetical protein